MRMASPERRLACRKERTVQYPDDFTRAKKVVRAKVAFYIHLTAYAVVNASLVAINLATSPGHLWFKWPVLGWGDVGERAGHRTADDRTGNEEKGYAETVALTPSPAAGSAVPGVPG